MAKVKYVSIDGFITMPGMKHKSNIENHKDLSWDKAIEDLVKISIKTNLEAAALEIRGAKVFRNSTRQAYRSLLRAFGQAENAHAAALDDWLGET